MNDSDILEVFNADERTCCICGKNIRAGKVVQLIYTFARTIDRIWSDTLEGAEGGLVTDNNYLDVALAHQRCLKKATRWFRKNPAP